MANWSDLKAAVASIVKTNGNKEITGQLLQNVLNNIISNVGLNSTFAGIATPKTNPGTPDGNVFYLATKEGTYPNFNGIVINSGEAVILEWKGSWVKKDSGFATQEKLSELASNVGNFYLVGNNKELSVFKYNNVIEGRTYRVYLDDINYDISGVPEGGYSILNIGYIVNGEATYLYQITKTYHKTLQKSYDVEIPKDSIGTEMVISIRATKGVKVWFRIEDVTDTNRIGVYQNQKIKMPCHVGYVNSIDGSIVELADCRYYSLDVKLLTNLRFKTSAFGNPIGYGFFMKDGSWQGVHTTTNEEVTIEVPKDAVQFLLSWNWNNMKDNPLYVWGDKVCASDKEVDFKNYKNSFKLGVAPSVGLISAEDGSIISEGNSRYVGVDVRKLSVISFKTTAFSGNYGYGFILNDGSWKGVHTTETTDVSINIPQNAAVFLLSWNYTILEENEIYVSGYADIDMEDVAYKEDEVYKRVASPQYVDEVKKELMEKMGVAKTELSIFVEASNSGRFDYKTVGLNDYYDAFNELTYTYPDFKKKEKLGDSQTTSEHIESYPINSYQYIRSGYSPTKHIVLCGAIHGDSEGWTNNGGDSAQNILCQYFFLREFLNNPDGNEYYSYISKNYIIDCVPIINPWGVQNHSRYNARGVDLNRNFDINWDITVSSVKGLSPFSETESKAWKDFVDSIGSDNIIYICEVHSRGNILIPQDNRWHSAIPTELIGYIVPIAEEMKEKYGGSYSIARQSEEDAVPNQFAWAYYKKGIFCFEPELCQTLANDVSTRNGFYVNLQMTDYLRLLFAKIATQLPSKQF